MTKIVLLFLIFFTSFNACSSDQFLLFLLRYIIDKKSAISITRNDELHFTVTNPVLLATGYINSTLTKNFNHDTDAQKKAFFKRTIANLITRKIITKQGKTYSIDFQQKLPIDQKYLSDTSEWKTLSRKYMASNPDDGRGILYDDLRSDDGRGILYDDLRSDVAVLFAGDLDSWENDLGEATTPTTHLKEQSPER